MGHSTLYQYKTLYGVENNVDLQGSVNENWALLIHEENDTSFLSNQLFSNEKMQLCLSQDHNQILFPDWLELV